MFQEFVETRGGFSVGYRYAFTISMCHLQDKFQLEQFIEKVSEWMFYWFLDVFCFLLSHSPTVRFLIPPPLSKNGCFLLFVETFLFLYEVINS